MDFTNYIGVAIMLFLAAGIGILLPFLSRLIGPWRPKTKKLMPYESGMDPVGTARERFSVKFYLVAMLFIIFDIEVIFLYPWAVQFSELTSLYGLLPLLEMLVFTLIIFAGYIYLRKKGALKWDN